MKNIILLAWLVGLLVVFSAADTLSENPEFVHPGMRNCRIIDELN